MKNKILLSLLFIICSALLVNVSAQSPGSKAVSKKVAEKWFHQKKWLGGLQLKPHKTVDIQEFAKQYRLNKVYWDEAFAFLKNNDLQNLAVGKYPIDGDNVFASVTEDATKDLDKTKWESHRKYIDLQYVIAGDENIGVASITKATVIIPYDETRDAANYTAEGKIYKAVPGTFFILFPGDVHRASITTGGNKVDKKIVIKIRVAG
jgi:biofilm protein TabA